MEIDPKFAAAWNNKGLALGNLGRNEEAIECFDKAIEIQPNNAIFWNMKGVALLFLAKYQEAIECHLAGCLKMETSLSCKDSENIRIWFSQHILFMLH